jgi:FixJ family two-component response regulator
MYKRLTSLASMDTAQVGTRWHVYPANRLTIWIIIVPLSGRQRTFAATCMGCSDARNNGGVKYLHANRCDRLPASRGVQMTIRPTNRMTDEPEATDVSVVYVVDDDRGIRRALEMLMRSVGFRVETFESPDEFLQFPRPAGPGCLILDVRLRGKSGMAFHQEIVNSGIRIPVVFITGHGDIEMGVKAMKAGALDFFAKPFKDQDMLDAVSQALARDSERLAAEAALSGLRASYQSLSPREKEVMGFVLSGLLNKQIASEMSLSEITVKVHRGQVMRKMNARSMPELVRMAESLGIEPCLPRDQRR